MMTVQNFRPNWLSVLTVEWPNCSITASRVVPDSFILIMLETVTLDEQNSSLKTNHNLGTLTLAHFIWRCIPHSDGPRLVILMTMEGIFLVIRILPLYSTARFSVRDPSVRLGHRWSTIRVNKSGTIRDAVIEQLDYSAVSSEPSQLGRRFGTVIIS